MTSRRPAPPRPRMLSSAAVILLGIAFVAADGSAQRSAITFEMMWDPSIGSTTVESIAQDATGFLWIGTQGGLVRYDGYEFEIFRNDAGDPLSIGDNFVRTILTEPDGKLWVGTVTGVNLYDPASGNFARYKKSADESSEFLGTTYMARYGANLVVGSDTGLYLLDPAGGSLARFPEPPGGAEGEPVSVVLVGKDGALWVGTRFALHSKSSPEGGFQVEIAAEENEVLTGIFEDRSGKIWSRWSNGVIQVLDPHSNPKHGFRVGPIEKMRGYRFSWEAMVQPNEDEIWVGTNTGIVVLDSATGAEQKKHATTEGTVQSLFVDRSGVIWSGIAGQGLGRYLVPNQAVSLIDEGLRVSSVGAAAEVKSATWIGTRGGGIYIKDPGHDELVHIDVASLTTPANDGFIRDILPIGDSVWVATNLSGVFRFDYAGKLLDRFTGADGLPSTKTFALASDSKGRVWVGTIDGGLAVIDPQDRRIDRVPFLDDEADEMHAPIIDIAIDPDDNVFLATEGSLVVIPVEGAPKRYTHDPTDPTSISHNGVTTLALDSVGRVWVGTRDGLNLMRPVGDGSTFRQFGVKDGLPHTYIDALMAGKDGEIWLATSLGVSRLDGESFDIVTFDANDGTPKGGFWIGGHRTKSDGTLLFASKEGLLIVSPDAVRWDYQPKLAVTKVIVKGMEQKGEIWRDLRLDPNRRDFSIEFAALDFSAPSKNAYSFRLEGYDEDWRNVDAGRRVATYTNLDPGSYTLHIRGTNRAGIWSESELAIPITVRPAFHEQWWFYAIVVSSALLLLYLIYLWRVRHIKAREQRLEHLVQERTADLEKANLRLDLVSKTDYLTGLPNRRGFVEFASHEMKRIARTLEPLCLAICDLDRFKSLNDSYGHDFGDFILENIARFLQEQVRQIDVVARWGGEEFIFLLPETDLKGGRILTEKILENLRLMRWVHEGNEIQMTMTFGVYQTESGKRLDECVKHADEALYDGKKDGGDRVVVWEK